MGFLSKIFRKRKQLESSTDDWENVVYERDRVDFRDDGQRNRYVTGCLEQMGEASRGLNLLTGEYSLITSYLTDMEEIEALPEKKREELNGIASRLVAMEQEGNK